MPGYSRFVGLQTRGTLNFYVRPQDGSDSNNGLSSSQALASLDELISRLNGIAYHRDPVIVHIGTHAAATGLPWTQTLAPRVLQSHIYFVGDGAANPGDDGFAVRHTGTAGAGSSQVVVGGLSGLGVNAFRGMTVEILSGAASGDRRTIQANDATTITPCAPFTAVVSSGDSFRVVEPQTLIDVPLDSGTGLATAPLCVGCGYVDDDVNFSTAQAPGVWLVNLRFAPNNSATIGALQAPHSRLYLYGVGLDSVQWRVLAPGGKISAGVESVSQAAGPPFETVPSSVTDLGATNNTSWVGWGARAQDAQGMLPAGGRQFYHGLVAGLVSLREDVAFTLRSGTIYGVGNAPALGILSGESTREYTARIVNFNSPALPIVIGGEQDAGQPGVFIRSGVCTLSNTVGGVTVNGGANAAAVRCAKLGSFVFEGAGSGIQFNGDFGLITNDGGRILAETEPTGATTSGDFSEDNGVTARAFGTLTNDSHFFNAGAWIGRI